MLDNQQFLEIINDEIDSVQRELWDILGRLESIGSSLTNHGYHREAQRLEVLWSRLDIDVTPYRMILHDS